LAYAYANGIVLTEALVVRSGTIAVHLKWSRQETCPLLRGLCFDGC
jgi:hypothetical protein